MAIETQKLSTAEIFISELDALETAPHTQRNQIEIALGNNESYRAKNMLADWAMEQVVARRKDVIPEDFEDFQVVLDGFLDSSDRKPTGPAITPNVADILEDEGLRARYLHRQLGGLLLADEATWTNRPITDYWRPAEGEMSWLMHQRLELSEYPVAMVIDRILADEIYDRRTLDDIKDARTSVIEANMLAASARLDIGWLTQYLDAAEADAFPEPSLT